VLTSYQTYAWSTEPPTAASGGRVVDDDLMTELVQRTVNEHLASKGMRSVPEGEARLLVTQQLSIAIRQEINDPYYTVVTDELYEEGSLRLDFVHRETGETVWWGVGRCRLADGVSRRRAEPPGVREDRGEAATLADPGPGGRHSREGAFRGRLGS